MVSIITYARFYSQMENRANEYMVCSGAPNRTRFHAVYVCDMAVDMITACEEIRDPASGSALKIKIGKGYRYFFQAWMTMS